MRLKVNDRLSTYVDGEDYLFTIVLVSSKCIGTVDLTDCIFNTGMSKTRVAEKLRDFGGIIESNDFIYFKTKEGALRFIRYMTDNIISQE